MGNLLFLTGGNSNYKLFGESNNAGGETAGSIAYSQGGETAGSIAYSSSTSGSYSCSASSSCSFSAIA